MRESNSATKPFLRRRAGFTGRLMNNISYPNLKKRTEGVGNEQSTLQTYGSECTSNCNQSSLRTAGRSSSAESNNGNESRSDNARPYTAGTTDSGYREDAGSVLLSPVTDHNGRIESVVIDVTNPSSQNSIASVAVPMSNGPSVINDVTDLSGDAEVAEVVSASLHRRSQNMSVEKASKNNLTANSTREFERMEAHINAITSPESVSDTSSHDTDGTRSMHWRQVIREFEAEIKTPLGRFEDRKVSSSLRSPGSTSTSDHSADVRFDAIKQRQLVKSNTDVKRAQMANLPLSSQQFETIQKQPEMYARVKKTSVQRPETAILEKSLEVVSSSSEPRINQNAEGLIAQLRNMVDRIGVASDDRRKQFDRLDNVFDEVVEDKESIQRQMFELQKRITQLEQVMRSQHENNEAQGKDHGRLRKDTAFLNRLQMRRNENESAVVSILKDQIGDLRGILRDLERQRSDLRSQVRRANMTVAEKNKVIEKLKEDKERVEKRLATLSNDVATARGRAAQKEMLSQAVSRASQKPAVTAATKQVTNATSEKRSSLPTRPNTNNTTLVRARPIAQSNDNTDTLSDTGDVCITIDGDENERPEVHQTVKNVHWNEPIATNATLTPPLYPQAVSSDPLNADMQLIITENNLVGRASLYRGDEDFTVYTTTHCGCSFYEYSNTDTRWVHPSKRFQVNYYGQAGATTVEIDGKSLLVRHFLGSQLEIYRASGETTLVAANGKRTEVIKDQSGSIRVEIYEPDGTVRVIGGDGTQTVHRAMQTSCFRSDGSYVSHVLSDDSLEWRSPDYVVRRFKNGDAKVRLNLIDTSVTMLVMDVGTIKHLSHPSSNISSNKYCAEWGTVARKRSRVAVQRHVLNQL